ncbi:MAG: ATP-binding protein [Spirochaetaceae bacterium]|nr:MAG: ATP-binding protein [Spirochaetaceae bacterium]
MHYTVCDYILDVFQNSVEAGASTISVEIIESPDTIAVTVTDDGPGMTAETQQKVLDPFYTDGEKHPGRRVGLGLPFVKQTADQTGGEFVLSSRLGFGTTVSFVLDARNLDTPPIGDVARTVRSLMCFDRPYEAVIRRTRRDGATYVVSRSELIDALGELESLESVVMLGQFLESLESGVSPGLD